MLITEAEAKTKICPKTYGIIEMPEYRQGGPWNCAASGCMWWRIEAMAGTIIRAEASAAEALIARYPTAYEKAGFEDFGGMTMVRRLADIGYCGAAGKP